jgi:hypothetical protein
LNRAIILLLCCPVWSVTNNLLAQGAAPAEPAGPMSIARMVSPDIDRPGEPFSYFSQPTDQIGVMHALSATEITPEGYLYTGFGELMFFVGADRLPVKQRIRTLEDGHLPILSYEFDHDGLSYRFTMFSASLGPEQTGADVVNFIRITVRNPGTSSKRGFLTTAWRYQGEQTTLGDRSTPFNIGDNRFRRPVTGKRPGDYQQPGASFNAHSIYTVQDNAFVQDGRAIYFFPTSPQPQITPSYRAYYNSFPDVSGAAEKGRTLQILPTTPLATAEYAVVIPPGDSRSLDFKMPVLPVAVGTPQFTNVQSASFDERHTRVRSFWNDLLARGMEITTPEDKVNQVFQTSLVNDLLSLNKIGDDYVQTVNQLHYHAFYLRDSADFVRMYDTSNYPEIAGQVLHFFATRQQPDGNLLSQPGQYDGWGQTMWTYGEHYRITGDKTFAAEVYPRMVHAMQWFEQATTDDPLHLMPSTDVRDNEYIPGHLTGYNFLALDGIDAAVRLAKDLGHADDAHHFQQVEDTFRGNFMKRLDLITAKTGGYIPPALDGDMGGADWGNLLSVTPEQQLNPWDPRVTATLKATQKNYAEGLITYRQPGEGVWLHHYLTIKNTLTEVIRGDQEQATREFYAELMHTSATNAGFEFSIRPWGDRDFSGNLSPHGWFAAEYRNLLRSMMVREEGSTLHLLSVISPAWIGAGKQIEVKRAATYFGTIGFNLQTPDETHAVLMLNPEFRQARAPEKIVVHLPWFVTASAVLVDGKPVKLTQNAIEISPVARRVEITWRVLPIASDVPASYDDAVSRYEKEYRERYERLNQGGL